MVINRISRFRDGARASLQWKASLWEGDQQHPCIVINLSLGGAKVQLDATIERGTIIRLEIPGIGIIDGQARWQELDSLGLQFSAPDKVRRLLGEKVRTLDLDKSR